MQDCARLLADAIQQAEENPGFLDTLLTILENEQNAGIRLSGMQSTLFARDSWLGCWKEGRTVWEKEQHEESFKGAR